MEHVLEGDSAVSSGLDAVEVSAEELSSILLHRGGNEAARQRDRTGSVQTGVSVGQGVTVDGGNDLGLGGAVDVADGRLSITVAQSGVLPLDVLNDTIGVLSGDVNSADQVAVGIEEPGVVGGLSTGLVQLEPLGVVIVGAVDGVLEVVVPDEGLCALDAVSLADDLSVVSDILAAIGSNRSGGDLNSIDSHNAGGVVDSVVGVGVDENIIALDIAVVGVLVSQNDGLTGSGAVNGKGDHGRSLQVALRIIGSFLHVGDLGKEGLDRDDDLSILVDLEQRALSAELLDGVERLNNILAAIDRAVGVQGELLVLLQADIVSDIALGGSNRVGSVGLGNKGGRGITSGVSPSGSRTAPLIGSSLLGELEVLLAEAVGLGADDLIGHIAEGRGVGDLSLLDALEQELSDQLTGSGSVQVGGLRHVVQNAELLRGLHGTQQR